MKVETAGYSRIRSARGSGIVEGTVGLMLIIGGCVLGTLLLADVAISAYWKEKLGFITDMDAQYTSTLPGDQQNAAAYQFAKDTFMKLGTPADQLSVSVSQTSISGQQAIKVSITNRFPLLITGVLCMPFKVNLQDSSVAVPTAASMQVAGSLVAQVDNHLVHPVNGGLPFYIPLYAKHFPGTDYYRGQWDNPGDFMMSGPFPASPSEGGGHSK